MNVFSFLFFFGGGVGGGVGVGSQFWLGVLGKDHKAWDFYFGTWGLNWWY